MTVIYKLTIKKQWGRYYFRSFSVPKTDETNDDERVMDLVHKPYTTHESVIKN